MNGYAFPFCGATLTAMPSGALYWRDAGLIVVGDLHLGKSLRLARRGGALLPPYEAEATLTKLDADLAATDARRVLCLGDSFDDDVAEAELPDATRLWLLRLMAGRDWTWIAGNHDPAPLSLGGAHRATVSEGPLTFRHIATPGARAEISAHYHPKWRVAGRSRPCFLCDGARLILPAYGAYTGGLFADDPALAGLLGPGTLAILTGPRAIPVPIVAPKPARPAFARRLP